MRGRDHICIHPTTSDTKNVLSIWHATAFFPGGSMDRGIHEFKWPQSEANFFSTFPLVGPDRMMRMGEDKRKKWKILGKKIRLENFFECRTPWAWNGFIHIDGIRWNFVDLQMVAYLLPVFIYSEEFAYFAH